MAIARKALQSLMLKLFRLGFAAPVEISVFLLLCTFPGHGVLFGVEVLFGCLDVWCLMGMYEFVMTTIDTCANA